MLNTCRMGYQYPTLTSFWASIATEAVAAMLDNARSTRRELQKQNQEDVILCFLPILNECLSLDTVPDLRIGCYMVLTVLASKVDLDDGVMTALMEAVTLDWKGTSNAGLICLSVLAERREDPELPKKVFKAILALERLDADLSTLSGQFKVNNLVLGVVLGIISRLDSAEDASRLRLVRTLMEANLMDEASTVVAIRSILLTLQTVTSEPNSIFDSQGSVADLLLRLADSTSIGSLVQNTVKSSEHSVGRLEMRLQKHTENTKSSPELVIEDIGMDDRNGQAQPEDFDVLTSQIPTRTAYEISFLSHSVSYVFSSLSHVFSSISTSALNVAKFSDLPVLRKSLASSEPLFLSFFIRLWCGESPTDAKTAAIRTVSEYVAMGPLEADLQILLPYLVYALADPSPKVRCAAAELLLTVERAYTEAERSKSHAFIPVLGHEQIYGQGKEARKLSWLSISESRKFITGLLVPGVQECLVDRRHICQLLSDSLDGSNHSSGSNRSHKTSLRLAIFDFLGSHAVNTPLYTVKHRLLQTLNRVTKVSGTSRTKLLLPLLSHCAGQTQDEYQRMCRREQLDPFTFLDQIVDIVIPTDRDGVLMLKSLIESGVRTSFPGLETAALRRIRAIWPSIKPDLQTSIASTLLERTLKRAGPDASGHQESEAMESLRALPLSTTILQSFVEGLPSIHSTLQDKPLASKRRRTSNGNTIETALYPKSLSLAIKHISLVLELVEDAKAERHPDLLKGLFEVMSDLQDSQSRAKAATDYLLILTIDSMLAIVKRAEGSTGLAISHLTIRTDVLIDCVRTTTSPQVRNTALLLVSALATVAPELVLHSVMPIFTFMGANLLRQDDDFSAHVVKQTMESVIPRLVQSLHKRKDGAFVGVSELLLSFAAAYEHIPAQRRLNLFMSLVDKVGSSEYLFALLAILMDKYPDDQRVVQFAVDLTTHYDVKARLQTMERYLEVVLDARKPKPAFSASLLLTNKNVSVESTAVNMLRLPIVILSDQTLVSKVTKKLNKEDEDAATIRSSYAQILEEIFVLVEQSRGSRKLEVSCMRVLDASLSLSPIRELIDTLQHLLTRTNDNFRRQVLRSFEYRLSDVKMDQKATQTACFAFLPRLLSFIQESRDTPLRNIAVSCVGKISEKFGKNGVPAIVDAAQTVSMSLCLGSAESSHRVASFISLATMVEVTGDAFISIVPNAFAKAMDNLASSIQEDTDDPRLHNAVYTFLSALLLYLPWVVTGADLDRLLKISYQSANAEMGEECDQRRIEALQLVSRKVEAKEFFAALNRTWADAMSEGPIVRLQFCQFCFRILMRVQAVKEYLEILGLAIDNYPKSIIVKQSATLGDLLLRLFDLRRTQLSPPREDSYSADEIEEVEDGVNESAIAMVYKLNDATFKPLFSRILEWTRLSDLNQDKETDTKAVLHRQATWYKFLLKFFDTLKVVPRPYLDLESN